MSNEATALFSLQVEIQVNPAREEWQGLSRRPIIDSRALYESVREILDQVRREGDAGVRALSRRFDGVDRASLRVSKEEIAAAVAQGDSSLQEAMKEAQNNIERFHAAHLRRERVEVETLPGVRCWSREVPIERVGLYIPGGTAPLFSTVLMLAVPARLAGCPELALFTPPRRDGTIHPAVLAAASLTGITEIYGVGGAQAVGAMSYGTESIRPVLKIFGPGNQYVTAAKELVAQEGVHLDLPAGPSEVAVYADHTANPRWVAADLLSQAEHGADSQVVLVASSEEIAQGVVKEVEDLLLTLPRASFAEAALESSRFLVFSERERAVQFMNFYAPEHLILNCEDALAMSERICNAGSVFIGPYTPESVGDYASGTNHVLPTAGHARAVSGVGVESFLKRISFQELSRSGLARLGPTVERLATEEGLEAHRLAVSVRLEAGERGERGRELEQEMSSEAFSGIDNLLRPHLRSFTPYSSARDEFHGDAGVFLNANENPLAETEYCRYPDSKQRVLKRVIGEYFSVRSEQIFLGSGSDEAIDLIIRAFCSPGKDSIATIVPSYGMYRVAAHSHDVSVVEIELESDFSLDSQKVVERLGRNVKVLFLCSPNNPTGNVLSGEAIEEILRVFSGICVVDEAYGDFCEEQSVLPLLNHSPRLVVLRTFSKAWGLAGIRLGMAFGDPRLIEILTSIKLPYNVGVPAQERALVALSDRGAFERAKKSVIDERVRLTKALGECALVQRVYPSEANFLLVQFDRSDEVFSRLESRGVIVRDRGREPLCGGCLRITVGTPKENQKLLRELNLFAEEARGEGVSKRGENHE